MKADPGDEKWKKHPAVHLRESCELVLFGEDLLASSPTTFLVVALLDSLQCIVTGKKVCEVYFTKVEYHFAKKIRYWYSVKLIN